MQGTVEVREVDVAPLAPGRVVRVLVDEGATVHVGDTLVILTAPTVVADVEQAAARVAVAEATLRDLAAGARSQERDAAAARLAGARADAERLARDRDRARALLDAGALAQRDFDAADAAATIAAEAARAAAESLRLLEAGTRPGQLAAARAEVAAARAALAGRQASAAEFVVTAPVEGMVLSRVADPGDLLAAGRPALVVGVMAEPWVRVYVPARVLPQLTIGSEVVIYPPGAGGAVVAADRGTAADTSAGVGRVAAINPRAEYVTRVALTEEERADLLFGVKVLIDDARGRFKPGLPVTVHLRLGDSAPP